MTKFKTIGAIALALSLAAASPSFAAGMRGGHGGGFHGGGANFHGGGYHGGIGPGVAAGLIAGAVIGSTAYGYYGAPDYDDSYGDSYGYYNNGYDSYDRSMSPEGNSN